MPRVVLMALPALIGALLCAQPALAAPLHGGRDEAQALRLTAAWLATYPPHLWLGIELPGDCRPAPHGRRACPVAITLRAWTHGELAPWRCRAEVLLPPQGSRAAARRTSARCTPQEPPASTAAARRVSARCTPREPPASPAAACGGARRGPHEPPVSAGAACGGVQRFTALEPPGEGRPERR
jgi:hypothetical protein